MKIEGNRPNVDATAASQVEAARTAASKTGEQGTRVSGDAVTVSPEVELASKAIASASKPVDIRPDAVARGKALLASGQLGNDAQTLADTMIQRMLDNQD